MEELFSPVSEEAVISILLNNPDSIYNVSGLKAFMFSATPHQELFSEMLDFAEKNLNPDLPLLLSSLDAKKTLDKVGGKKYVEKLVKGEYRLDTLEEHVKIVMSSYKARAMVSLASQVNVRDLNVENVDMKLHEWRNALDSISDNVSTNGTVAIGDIVRDTYDGIVARTENPGVNGVTWGIKDLDLGTGGKAGGDYYIVCARPGMGKTSLVCNSILADGENNSPSLLFSREMMNHQLAERLVSLKSGISVQSMRLGILKQKELDTIYATLGKLKPYPIYIDTSFRTSDMYYIESVINKYKSLHDIKTVYVDYIQLLADRGDNQTAELGRLSRLFKTLSNELDICIIVVSQLNRGVESRENKRPMLSDLRQSGNLEEDADFVIGLYRDDYYYPESKDKGMVEASVLKARNGPTGTILLKFEAETNKITGIK